MGNILTDKEAIKQMQSSLQRFNADTNQITISLIKEVGNLHEICIQHMKRTENEVKELENSLKDVASFIANLQSDVQKKQFQLVTTTKKILALKERKTSLESEISNLRYELGELNAYLANTEDPDEMEHLYSRISCCRQKINNSEQSLCDIKDEIFTAETEVTTLNSVLDELKRNLSDAENKKEILSKKYDFYSSKKNKQATMLTKLEEDIESYIVMLKRYSSSITERSEKNDSALTKCLEYIDEYLNAL